MSVPTGVPGQLDKNRFVDKLRLENAGEKKLGTNTIPGLGSLARDPIPIRRCEVWCVIHHHLDLSVLSEIFWRRRASEEFSCGANY